LGVEHYRLFDLLSRASRQPDHRDDSAQHTHSPHTATLRSMSRGIMQPEHDPDFPDVDPATGDEAETEPNAEPEW
jgi:hypothetical protein